MGQREIAEWEVKLAMNQPNSTAPGREGATNYWKQIGDRVIRVTATSTTVGTGKHQMTTVTIVTVALKDDEE